MSWARWTRWRRSSRPATFAPLPCVSRADEYAGIEIAELPDDLLAYVGRLVEHRRADPGPDLITALLESEADGGKLSHDEVIAMVANLFVGGRDTTASQLACMLHTPVRTPDEFARVREDRSLPPHAVAETIRFEPSTGFVPRTAMEPVHVGQEVPAGALMYLCTASARPSRVGSGRRG